MSNSINELAHFLNYSGCVVTVNKTSVSLSIDTYFKCDLTLVKLRESLKERGWMDPGDYFQTKKYSVVDKEMEWRTTLKDILVNDTIIIDHPNNKKGNILLNFLKGFTISDDGSIESTTHNLYSFDEGYKPSDNQPQIDHEYDTSLAFSNETVQRQTSGIDAASLSLSSPSVSAEAEYKKESSKTNGNGKIKTYLTTRSVYNRKNVQIDPKELRISDDFKEKLEMAIEENKNPKEPNELNVEQAKQLMEVLDTYGWFIVTKYTLGGGFYVTEVKEASSYNEAVRAKEDAELEAEGKFGGYGASGRYHHGSTDDTSNESSSKSEQKSFNQIGGGASAHLSPEKFDTAMGNESNWRIVKYEHFEPSMILLERNDPKLYEKCVKLLIVYGIHLMHRNNTLTIPTGIDLNSYLKSLPHMRKYSEDIVQKIMKTAENLYS